jgi:exodeoxyribonuclease VIII
MNAHPASPQALVLGLANAAYHAVDALGSSGLKKLDKSPLHFRALVMDPHRPQAAPSAAFKAGTLAHCAVLEPDTLAQRYIARPEWVKGNTTEGKAWLKAVAEGVEAVTAEDMETALAQASALRALPEIGDLLGNGQAEVSAFWTDDITQIRCKCRPDFVSPAGDQGVILLDVKTAKDASPRGFGRAVWDYGYHMQAAHYSDGYALASGLDVLGFVFAVVESEYPHAACAYMLDDEAMQMGRATNRRLMNVYADCRRLGLWPGYTQTITQLALPPWAR